MAESGQVGPVREQTDEPVTGFQETVAGLSDGSLLHEPPFDLRSASALARNIDTGPSAEALFTFDRERKLHYRVLITAYSPDQPELGEREVVDTVAHGTTPLVALLETVIDEVAEHG